MSPFNILHMVTGAPGAGKSTTLEAFLPLKSPYVAFDIDWLGVPASELAGKDIFFDPSMWRPYGAVWLEVLHAIHKNGKVPVFFAPTSPRDIAQDGQPTWCREVAWLLLDCDDATRRRRLLQRPGWTAAMIEEAIEDAHELRHSVALHIDTAIIEPQAVARTVHAWVAGTNGPR